MRKICFLLLLGTFLCCGGPVGCALWPFKKTPVVEAAASASATPTPNPDAPPPHSKPRKSWIDWILFWRKPPPPSAPAQPLSPRARVYFVNIPARLVVLEVPSATDLPVGLVLSGLSQGRVSSTVRVAPERRPPFAVAEILTGDPQHGENLYLVEP